MGYYNPKILIFVTVLTAAGVASIAPITGFMNARFQFVLYNSQYVDQETTTAGRNESVWQWLIVIFLTGVFVAIERIGMGIAGENLTFLVRRKLIRALLYKQLSWYDSETRAPGILCTNFAEDIS